LEHRCGEHRTCWPGYADLAELVGCSARWIPELLKPLVKAGLVLVEYRQGKSNVYTLLGRVERQPKATQEVTAPAPRKANNYEQKQPTKTNEIRASRPNNGGIDFSKYLPGGNLYRSDIITSS
jgi:hypothetical protein